MPKKQDPKTEKKKAEKKVTAYSVFDKGGNYVRTYSIADHDDAFQKLAEQYADKIKGSIRKATEDEENGNRTRAKRKAEEEKNVERVFGAGAKAGATTPSIA